MAFLADFAQQSHRFIRPTARRQGRAGGPGLQESRHLLLQCVQLCQSADTHKRPFKTDEHRYEPDSGVLYLRHEQPRIEQSAEVSVLELIKLRLRLQFRSKGSICSKHPDIIAKFLQAFQQKLVFFVRRGFIVQEVATLPKGMMLKINPSGMNNLSFSCT